MKKNNIRFETLTLVFLSTFLLLALSVSAASITCVPCNQGNCNCNINTCNSGFLTIYKNSDCSGSPVFKMPFTNGASIWFPDSFGDHYGKVLCDDRTIKSECAKIPVSQIASSCTNDACDQQCKNSGKASGACDSNNQCQCSGATDECDDGTSYGECSSEKPKFCTTSGKLVDDCEKCKCPDDLPICNSDGSCDQKSKPSPSGDSGILFWIIIIVVIVVVVVYFIFLRKKPGKSPKASYEDLYRKWSK